LIPSRIIEQCAAYCKQQEFEFLIFVKNAWRLFCLYAKIITGPRQHNHGRNTKHWQFSQNRRKLGIKRTGITVARYDFSGPQSGKDICDRKIAPMKAHIRRFVNENHDVVSAEDTISYPEQCLCAG
jgi:hypothetical protein